LTFEASSPLLQHIRAGRLRALAVTSSARIPDLPDVPTASESGFPELVVTTWTGVFAPAGTDAAIVGKLNRAINDALSSPELQSALAKVGNAPLGGPPEALARMLAAEQQKWARSCACSTSRPSSKRELPIVRSAAMGQHRRGP
jgi:tripartite-type tricarboxylate transporter receptor subunit TctC